MAKAKRIKEVYGDPVDYTNAVKDGLIIPRTPSTPSDELKKDYNDGKIVARPGMPGTNLANLDFSQEALLTKYSEGRQETAARKFYEANIDHINRVRKSQCFVAISVDECVTAAKAVYDILNDKGTTNPDLKEAMEKGLIVERYPVDEDPSAPIPNKKVLITFKGGEDAQVDGKNSKKFNLHGSNPTDVELSSLTFPTVTIKAAKASTKERDADKWSCSGGLTGVKTEAEIKAATVTEDTTFEVVTKDK